MQDNRNNSNGLSFDGRGTVCIDTMRVLDCCRDRDCFEDTRVYLSEEGESIINNATGVRLKKASVVWAFVGIDPIAFNRGFYRVTVRYYIKVEGEGCLGIGRSQCFTGIAVLEKEVVLYGGEGSLVSFSSSEDNNFCNICDYDNRTTDSPVAVVETVEPIILGQRVADCSCPCSCNECCVELPENVCGCLGGAVSSSTQGARLYVSFGIFSVIRILRPTQLLIQATDYSVPEKECTPATSDENPCTLFRTMAFPVNEFRTHGAPVRENNRGGGGCGCQQR